MLLLLLIAALVISVAGTAAVLWRIGTGVTGYATTNVAGVTNFTVNSSLSIRFANALIPFGTGTVNDSAYNCTMGTNNTAPTTPNCIGFNATVVNQNLTIENNGNVAANISLNFSGNASMFMMGTPVYAGIYSQPSYQYMVYNHKTGSCTTLSNATAMKEINNTDASAIGTHVCTFLNQSDTQDTIGVAVWLRIPKDTPTGVHTSTVTAIACDDNSC